MVGENSRRFIAAWVDAIRAQATSPGVRYLRDARNCILVRDAPVSPLNVPAKAMTVSLLLE